MKKIFNPLVRVISSRQRSIFNYQQQQCHIIIPPASTILNTMGMVKDVVAKGDDIFASLGINTAKRELNATVAMVNAHLVSLNRQGIIRPQEHRIIKIYIDKAKEHAEENAVDDEEDITTTTNNNNNDNNLEENNTYNNWFKNTYDSVTTSAASAARQGTMVLDTSVRTLTGMETYLFKLQVQKERLQFINNALLTHSTVQNNDILQEILIATSINLGYLNTTCKVMKTNNDNNSNKHSILIEWDTDFPNERISSWDIELKGNAPGSSTYMLQSNINSNERTLIWPLSNNNNNNNNNNDNNNSIEEKNNNNKIINSILNPTTKDSTRTYTTSLNLGYHIVVTPHSNGLIHRHMEEKNIPPGISDTITF